MNWKSLLALIFVSGIAHAALVGKTIDYKEGKTVLEGYLVYDDAVQGKRPGVIVVPDWMGMSPFAQDRAEQLAKMGYIAIAADIYGKGIRPKDAKEAMQQVALYKGNRPLMRARAKAALDTLVAQSQTDASRVAAIGYCFGGTTVLELARSGAPLVGVVSFHGGLDTPTPEDAKNIKGKVLILHGADDPHVPPDQVAAFEKEMNDAKVDWQLVKYSGAVHAFAVPTAGNDPSKGVAYNPSAARRSWQAMKDFFAEIFAQ
jgi:dienelactone hydrolase